MELRRTNVEIPEDDEIVNQSMEIDSIDDADHNISSKKNAYVYNVTNGSRFTVHIRKGKNGGHLVINKYFKSIQKK